MILNIEKYGSEKLRVPAQKVAVTPELIVLAEDMLETMYKAKGVGLAAEQVGRTEALCVIDVPLSCEDDEETKMFNSSIVQPLVMFNPEIVKCSDRYEAEEGCLSLTGTRKTKRWKSIKVQYQNEQFQTRFKTFTGWTSQIIQHEIDHCNGIIV